MNCPACAAPAPGAASECAACGVIFAKFKDKREKERKAADEFLALTAAPNPKPFDPWIGRGIAAAILFIWCAILAIYYVKAMNRTVEREREQERRAAAPARK